MTKKSTAVPVKRDEAKSTAQRTVCSLLGGMEKELEWTPSFRLQIGSEIPWAPRVDAYEKNGDFVIITDLPGVAKDDVGVTLQNGNLVVKGERKEESEVNEQDYYRCERFHGSFYRSVPLPFETDHAKVKATFNRGVLEVHVPVPKEQEKSEPQKIAVT